MTEFARSPSGPSGRALTEDAQSFGWLLANFVRNTDGVTDAVAVSSDGLLIALSDDLPRDDGEHLAATVAGITSLAKGVSRRYGFEGLKLVMIEMRGGFLLVSSISAGSSLGVLATGSCDVGLIGYEMAMLASQAGTLLTPQLIIELKNRLAT